MIAHVVLFTPRSSLSATERQRFHDALTRALETIPGIVSHRIGRRLRTGARYDAATSIDGEFFAMLEFADRQGLADYLSHPAHEELGRLFYEMSERAMALDYEVVDRDVAGALAGW